MLNDDQEAGCVEQPRHIRLLQNGAGNLGRTTCFFHIRYQPTSASAVAWRSVTRSLRIPWASNSDPSSDRGSRPSNVTHRKNHEIDRPDHADDRAERIECERYNQARQPSENVQRGMIGKHIGVKTNAERERADKVVDKLDRNGSTVS